MSDPGSTGFLDYGCLHFLASGCRNSFVAAMRCLTAALRAHPSICDKGTKSW